MFIRALLICCCVASAHAAPSTHAADDIERYLTERGLVAHMEQMRQSVGDSASDLVVNAMTFLGVPYRRGGTSANTGFDCSGFVRSMFEQTVGKVLPRRASEQAAVTEKIDKQDLKPGIWCFSTPCAKPSAMSGFMWATTSSSTPPNPVNRCAWTTCAKPIGTVASRVRVAWRPQQMATPATERPSTSR